MKIIDIADKFPAKLKSNCANHIDHILSQLGSTEFVGIHLAEYEVDNQAPLQTADQDEFILSFLLFN